MGEATRLAHFEKWLLDARELRGVWLVEGMRDARAVEALGLGPTEVLNQGKRITDRLDQIVERYPQRPIILFFDGDRTGHALHRKVYDLLVGLAPLDDRLRARWLRFANQNCVEEMPFELAALRERFGFDLIPKR